MYVQGKKEVIYYSLIFKIHFFINIKDRYPYYLYIYIIILLQIIIKRLYCQVKSLMRGWDDTWVFTIIYKCSNEILDEILMRSFIHFYICIFVCSTMYRYICTFIELSVRTKMYKQKSWFYSFVLENNSTNLFWYV